MSNLTLYALHLLVGGICAYLVFSISLFLTYLFGVFQEYRLSNGRLAFPGFMFFPLTSGGILLLYFSAAWAAFCVYATARYTDNPEVTRDWVYFVLGTVWCLFVFVVWATLAEKKMDSSWQRVSHILNIMFTITIQMVGVLTLISCVVFALFPNLIQFPYGWLTNLLDKIVLR